MIIAAMIISTGDPLYAVFSCDKLASFYEDDREGLLENYPMCESMDKSAAVEATMMDGGGENVAAALNVTFGMALWLAMAIHAIGVEIYVRNRSSYLSYYGILLMLTSFSLAPPHSGRV